MKLQDLIIAHCPTVIKIDAEGAEKCLMAVNDFWRVRAIIGEYDFRHNPAQKLWLAFQRHLKSRKFVVDFETPPPFTKGVADFSGQGRAQANSGRNFRALRHG